MKAAVLRGPYRLEIEEVPIPEPGPQEVVIKVAFAGICGTDVLIYKGLHSNATPPVIPGHEFSGHVHQVGNAVSNLAKGQKVSARASWGCGECQYCLDNTPALCRERKMLGVNADGAFAEYVKVPAKSVIPLPENVQLEEAQSLIPLACGVHAFERLNPQAESKGIIFGSGHSGLLLLQVFLANGFTKLAVVGGSRVKRVELAKQLGAPMALGTKDQEFNKTMQEFSSPGGVDFAVEASGSGTAVRQAVEQLKPGGDLLCYAIYEGPMDNFPINALYNKEISIIGSKGAGNCYLTAAELLAKRDIEVKALISHYLSLSELVKGYEMMDRKDPEALRIAIKI